jgi:phosphohistidine phosphatase
MTLTLILTRHAKSDWDDPALDDHDRPLNARGRRDAPRIGRWLKENDLYPEHALCSSATRARETLDGIAPDVPTLILSDLYLAAPRGIASVLMAASPERQLLIAHNPGIAAFAAQIVAKAPDHPRFHDYPTAATLVVDFDIDDWSALAPGTGHARAFFTPHDLPE